MPLKLLNKTITPAERVGLRGNETALALLYVVLRDVNKNRVIWEVGVGVEKCIYLGLGLHSLV